MKLFDRLIKLGWAVARYENLFAIGKTPNQAFGRLGAKYVNWPDTRKRKHQE